MPDPADISPLVTAVFAAWRNAGIEFLILRNYENLPHATTNDIDVLVPRRDRRRAEQLLRAAAGKNGFVLLNRAEFATRAFYFAKPASVSLSPSDGERAGVRGSPPSIPTAHFDLFTALRWRGFDFTSCTEFLRRRLPRGDFSVPHPAHEAVTSLLATFIFTGRVKEKYRAGITAGFRAEPAATRALLARSYGPQLAARLVELGTAARWNELEALVSPLRRALVWRQAVRRPLHTLGALFGDAARLARRCLRPPGLTVVLCGADGCGKSTVATRLIERLAPLFSPAKGAQFHWKPPVFSAKRQAGRAPTTDPHGRSPRPRPVSLVFFALHWLEFFLGWFLRVRPVTFRGGLVLIDRFYYDFFVDPRRYRLNVPRALVQLGHTFLPKPDLVFLLDAPPDVLQSRKREVPFAETGRQRLAFRELIGALPNGVVLDATQSPEQVAASAGRAVMDFLAARSARRHGES